MAVRDGQGGLYHTLSGRLKRTALNGGGPGGWGCATVAVSYAHYRVYGDKSILEKYYDNMRMYLDSMEGFSEDGLVVREREGGWCLGDWCPPDPIKLPEPFVNTFYYIKSMWQVTKISNILGCAADYSDRIDRCMKSLVENYYNAETNEYCGGGLRER